MRQLAALAVCVVIASCSDSSSAVPDGSLAQVDAPPPDAAAAADAPGDAGAIALTCKQISDEAASLIATLDASCDAPADCEVFSPPAPRDCGGTPLLGGDDRAVRKGWSNDRLAALIADFAARCRDAPCSGSNPCIVDWAPPAVTCLGHVCGVTRQSCLPPPPDAGI